MESDEMRIKRLESEKAELMKALDAIIGTCEAYDMVDEIESGMEGKGDIETARGLLARLRS